MNFYLLSQYLNYLWKAKNAHDLHSPFLYSFYTEVINDKEEYYCFSHLKDIRTAFENDIRKIINVDYGAGSKQNNEPEKFIKDIARYGITREKYARLLFRMINYFNSKNILELGTSLGLTTLYLAKANSESKVTAFEGNPALCQIAQDLFDQEQQKNIRVVNGNFDDTLKKELELIDQIDFLFIDGNHRKDATLRYFEMALEKKQPHSVFVFDDIHWSKEMNEAWTSIRCHPGVTLSIDLFQFGIVFFRNENYFKNHVILKF